VGVCRPAWGEHAVYADTRGAAITGRLLTGAGLADVAVAEVPVRLHDDSFDAWLTRTSALAGPLAKRLALLPDPARRELRARLTEAVRPYQTPDGLDFPGVSLVASGRRR
jgi:enediyne biosynthesis protein CalE5